TVHHDAIRREMHRVNGRLEHLRGSALGFRSLTNYIAKSSPWWVEVGHRCWHYCGRVRRALLKWPDARQGRTGLSDLWSVVAAQRSALADDVADFTPAQ